MVMVTVHQSESECVGEHWCASACVCERMSWGLARLIRQNSMAQPQCGELCAVRLMRARGSCIVRLRDRYAAPDLRTLEHRLLNMYDV
eukprot:scaffold326731_cov86-Tisochrysis_lutea.AAC.1